MTSPIIALRLEENIVSKIASTLAEAWLSKEELIRYFGEANTIQFLAQFEDFLVVGELEEKPACDYYALGETEVEAQTNKANLLGYYHELWDR